MVQPTKRNEEQEPLPLRHISMQKAQVHGQVHVHGQRIGAAKLEELGLRLEFLEDDQSLQDDVLTAYHLMTLIFEKSNAFKFIASDKGKMWVKQGSGVSFRMSKTSA